MGTRAGRNTAIALRRSRYPIDSGLASGDTFSRVVVLGDCAPWIWNLAAELFPRRVEILDGYHADEHVSATARTLYDAGTDTARA